MSYGARAAVPPKLPHSRRLNLWCRLMLQARGFRPAGFVPHRRGHIEDEQACCRWILLVLGKNFCKIALSTASKELIWRNNLEPSRPSRNGPAKGLQRGIAANCCWARSTATDGGHSGRSPDWPKIPGPQQRAAEAKVLRI